jgi:putative CocE/NonD family hydrolase
MRVSPSRVVPILLLLVPAHLTAQADSQPAYREQQVMIPMRDGVKLNTRIYTPVSGSAALPFLLTRTPYGIAGSGGALEAKGSYAELAREQYIFVYQDIRGRFGSEGQFIMNRPLHDASDPKGVDESTDTYDTITWLLANVSPNNGAVGVLGISYPGWLAALAGVGAHPALKAISPQAPMTDTWLGDDFFHQGAFRLSYGFEYATDLELSNDESVPPPVSFYDTYSWYLAQGSLANLTKLLGGRSPTWTNFTQHPAYDAFWKSRALTTWLTEVAVPTLVVGGWWDQEDFYGAITTYAALEKLDRNNRNYLVMGPWYHGSWSRGDGQKVGDIDFGSATGKYFREEIQAPWFAWWLKGKGKLDLAEATLFESGSNQWRSFDSWPAKEGTSRKLYFRAGGLLSFDPPTSREARASMFDSYVSDPAHPVPYRKRPIELTYDPRGSHWRPWLYEDQRFVDGRPDILVWRTEPLTEDITIGGDIAAHLFASTTGSDADWVAKLIDVLPDTITQGPVLGGYQFMVSSEILRGRYRQGFDRGRPIAANAVNEYVVDLHQQSYTFRKGHRIMVQVQSTWFPAYDRNPQTFVPNIFDAAAGDFRAATHRVYRNGRYPSYIDLPVLGAGR